MTDAQPTRPDADLDWLRRARGRLRSALVSDALDALGHRKQTLSAGFRALEAGSAVVGRAFPVQIEPVSAVPEVPYVGLLAALDAIRPDDVYVAAVGQDVDVAIWGELVTTASRHKGAVGAICDGYARDTARIRELGFPVFCRGAVPTDSNGRSEVRAHNVSVTIDGVRIDPGDLVVADDDGVAVVPAHLVVEVIAAAIEKDSHESEFRLAISGGMGATEAFAKFGVL